MRLHINLYLAIMEEHLNYSYPDDDYLLVTPKSLLWPVSYCLSKCCDMN